MYKVSPMTDKNIVWIFLATDDKNPNIQISRMFQKPHEAAYSCPRLHSLESHTLFRPQQKGH